MEVHSSFLTLHTAFEKTLSPQCPLSSFDHVTQSSSRCCFQFSKNKLLEKLFLVHVGFKASDEMIETSRRAILYHVVLNHRYIPVRDNAFLDIQQLPNQTANEARDKKE